MRGLVTALALIAALSGPAPAQQAAESSVSATSGTSTILTLDQERLFEESQWGQRALAEINADSSDLAAENRRIEAELSAEEQDLANRRATMAAQEFRALADAFDAKVVEIRRNQDAKLRDLNREQRQLAYGLMELMAERGNQGEAWEAAVRAMDEAVRGA